MTKQTVLIPVIFPEPELQPVADTVIAGLDGFDIVLFGYWQLPENTTEDVARETHGTEAEALLYEMAAKFSRAGASTEIQLQFGPAGADQRELQTRISEETDPDAVLIADQLSSFHNILVPMRDDRNRREIVEFVSGFDTEDVFIIELYHVAADERDVEPATEMLESVSELLLDRGFSRADIETTVEVAPDPQSAIAAKASGHNIVVTGQPAGEAYLFSPVCEYVADHTKTPIAVIRDREDR